MLAYKKRLFRQTFNKHTLFNLPFNYDPKNIAVVEYFL